MNNKNIFWFLLCTYTFWGQNPIKDTLAVHSLDEIVVVGTKASSFETQTKLGSSIDDFLQKAQKVDLVKRGAYAWEPLINGMASERTIVSIDGMRIFGACTDKMDPVTSYVEVSNLSEASISSGQQGSCHGNTIGGAIDLKMASKQKNQNGWDFKLLSGVETNNKQTIFGLGTAYSNSLLYVNTNIMFRKAENYFAGKNQEVLFSQFQKMNFSWVSGFRLSNSETLEASLIYDKATDVGYPALPMDVSLAKALITSVKFSSHFDSVFLNEWESKVYYNTITHTMDDTKRPNVPIHMDMPGWSTTIGWYSKIKGKVKDHQWQMNWNGFFNKSVAEMTMYPANPSENLMFMYTWPDVRTLFSSVYLEDIWMLNGHSMLKTNLSLGLHNNTIGSEFGKNSLQIFYPNLASTTSRFLKSIASNYSYDKNYFQIGTGFGYGERAPSVSEGYGFYLFNSFDNFDYIGNPNLKSEQSFEYNFFMGLHFDHFNTKVSSSFFYIKNYIIGIPDSSIAPMTIGATGVKVYNALPFATIWNTDWTFSYVVHQNWIWKGQVGYAIGQQEDKKGLPFMSPIHYSSQIQWNKKKFLVELGIQGNSKQTRYNSFYGEDATPAFTILNSSIGYYWKWNGSKFTINAGVENAFDIKYSTFSDWNNLPRMGRNFFTNLLVQF